MGPGVRRQRPFRRGRHSGAGRSARASALWVGGGNSDGKALDQRAAMLEATEHLVVATGIASIWAWDRTSPGRPNG